MMGVSNELRGLAAEKRRAEELVSGRDSEKRLIDKGFAELVRGELGLGNRSCAPQLHAP